jgi:hypothetical protein
VEGGELVAVGERVVSRVVDEGEAGVFEGGTDLVESRDVDDLAGDDQVVEAADVGAEEAFGVDIFVDESSAGGEGAGAVSQERGMGFFGDVVKDVAEGDDVEGACWPGLSYVEAVELGFGAGSREVFEVGAREGDGFFGGVEAGEAAWGSMGGDECEEQAAAAADVEDGGVGRDELKKGAEGADGGAEMLEGFEEDGPLRKDSARVGPKRCG